MCLSLYVCVFVPQQSKNQQKKKRRKLYKIDFPTRTMAYADNEAPLKRNQINLSTTITINYKRPRRLLSGPTYHSASSQKP